MDMNFVKLHERLDKQLTDLYLRVGELEEEIMSLKSQIKDATIEKNIYNTSSTVSQNTIDIDLDRDYGQQSF
jgi:hypothetical protein|tara:strand:+ start:349 stop:564 length:216 start_codon:yes stop_codon:yes gene_type:complete